jgi:transcriptional regulator with XRE-family HTH domain
MEDSHAERLKFVVRWLAVALGKTQADIARECGYDNSTYFSQLLNGRKPIAASLDEKVAALHPDLNVEFLRGNSDSMFIPGASQPAMPAQAAPPAKKPRPEGVFIPAELVQMFTDLSATVRSQQETIRLLVGKKGVAADVAM